ncbi:MAG: response regulator transcription factor [Nibricoccus sp.]
MKAKILIAEDDANIRHGLNATLESDGYAVTPVVDGVQALKVFAQDKFDLVILDVMMPKKSGYDVCREIRARDSRMPILFLTAKGEEIDKVVGLKLGADDYMAKPFGVHELLARVEALLRRGKLAEPAVAGEGLMPPVFRFGDAEVDRKKFTATVKGESTPLTAREVKLLEVFASHPGEVLTRDALLNAVWGIDYLGTTRTLDQHVAQLRKKVEVDPESPKAILTVHGVGYRYDA